MKVGKTDQVVGHDPFSSAREWTRSEALNDCGGRVTRGEILMSVIDESPLAKSRHGRRISVWIY